MALAKAIVELRARADIRIDNYATFLAREGATAEAMLVAPSAWSCAHGVERWRSDCGCRSDFGVESSQAWRGPLREALEWLAGELHAVFERDGTPLLGDPWAARDAYGVVVGAVDDAERRSFVRGWMETVGRRSGANQGDSGTTDLERALDLLEMERNALRLFTSCAWFFDDVGGLEPRQVLLYAARALELAGPEGAGIRSDFVEMLRVARSNDEEVGTAADVFEAFGGAGPGHRVATSDAAEVTKS